METSSTLWCTGDRQHCKEFIRRFTLQICACGTADRCIPSKDQCHTRLFTFALPPGGRPDCEDLHISREARNTMDSLDATRRFGLRR
ncbi:unnamed protein product [Schistosoma mattheei]|uniref:Uncharacterized protein n=1 Tax=Schistosoma mattheei TaxID=31246 RepID=A0A183PTU2_9TREM|nr:unnamed protein product [Schistosoma mattheei]